MAMIRNENSTKHAISIGPDSLKGNTPPPPQDNEDPTIELILGLLELILGISRKDAEDKLKQAPQVTINEVRKFRTNMVEDFTRALLAREDALLSQTQTIKNQQDLIARMSRDAFEGKRAMDYLRSVAANVGAETAGPASSPETLRSGIVLKFTEISDRLAAIGRMATPEG